MKPSVPFRLVRLFPLLSLLFLSAFLCAAPYSADASVSNYRLTVKTGKMTDMSGATTVWSGYPGSRDYNDTYGNYNIGFNFVFDGVTYTDFGLYVSGLITLGDPLMYTNYDNQLASTSDVVIAPFWDMLWQCGGGNGMCTQPNISFLTSGTAPNRVLTVEWQGMETVERTIAQATFQVRLYEGTNRIEFVYGDMQYQSICGYCNGCSGSTSASIGLANGSDNFLSVTPSGGTSGTADASNANDYIDLQSTGINSGTMYVFSNVDNVQLSATPKTVNVGNVATGDHADFTVRIKHAGTAGKLDIKSATMTGDPDYTLLTSTLPTGLNVGDTATLTVRFAPIANGPRAATLTLTSNGLDSGTQQIVFSGIGLAPFIGLDTNILFKKSFTKLGQSVTGYIIVKSTSIPTLVITGYSITGIDADQYAITRYPASALPGGTSDTLGVTYTPTREGRHAATLNIFSNAVNFPTEQIQLIGTGILPHIVVSPIPMTFDSTALGDSVCKTLTIYNPGTDTLRILSNLLSSSEGDFIYTPLTGSDTIIPPDKSRQLNICFKPRQSGSREGKVILTTNIIKTFESIPRDTAGTIAISLSGSAVAYGGLSLSVNSNEILDSAIVGTEVCRPDTIRNTGEAEVILTSITIAGINANEFTTNGITLPYHLTQGSFVVLNICTTPTAGGLRVASLTIGGTSSGKNVGTSSALSTLGLSTCLQPSPVALFESVQLYRGSDSLLCDTVTNCGDIDAIYTANISGTNTADYTVTPTTSTVVSPGATAVFCVQYHPATTGTSSATLTISAPNTTSQTVVLGGSACCAYLTSDAVAIPATNAGGHSTFLVTINNTGGCDWDAGIPVIEGDTDAFHIGAIGTVTGNGNKQVTINYDPTTTDHTYAAKISFPNGGPCQEDTLALNLTQQTGGLFVNQEVTQDGFAMTQNRPNPFSLTTSFTYTVPTESVVSVTLNDMTGKLVRTITTGRISAGEHIVVIDATELASGTYVIALRSGSVRLTRQIVITK